jgi:iron complex transport system permease protein
MIPVKSLIPRQGKNPNLRLIQVGGMAFRVNTRVMLLVGMGITTLFLLGAWGLTLGSFRLPLDAIAKALKGVGSRDADFIVLDLRLPRLLAAMMVGPMFAMSGAIFQGLIRNPLVSPDIIGINTGASLAAVFWIVTRQPVSLLPVAAFTGALMAAASIYVLTWRGRISGARLILVGIGVNALLSATTTWLILRLPIDHASAAVLWMVGTLYGSDWVDVLVLASALAVLAPLGIGLMWSLGVLQFGDLTARSLGMPLERTRLALIVVGCALSGVAVSVAGPVGFVAFMVPHLARMLAGPMTGGVFALAGVVGGVLLLGADLVSQHAFPLSLPVGVVTAALGAPYFLFLLYQTHARM